MPGPLGHVVTRLVVAVTLLGWPAAAVAGQDVVYTGTVQVSSGEYLFTERTTSTYIVNGLELSAGSVRLSATLPVISQSTPWVTYGSVPIPSGGAQSGEVERQIRQMGRMSGSGRHTVVTLPIPDEGLAYQTGIGDPLVRADVDLVTDRGPRPALRIHAFGKIPITDPDDGFGTGEWDYGTGVSLSKLTGRHSVLVDLAYWRFGDLPDLELKDGMAYGLGYGHVLGAGRWSLLASLSGWTSIIDGADAPVQLGLGFSRLLTPDRSVSISAGVGLTETAPDVSIALGWRLGL